MGLVNYWPARFEIKGVVSVLGKGGLDGNNSPVIILKSNRNVHSKEYHMTLQAMGLGNNRLTWGLCRS